jgi:hypothetical protein
MDSKFNECWYTFHVSDSASCLDENRGKVHVSSIRAFPRFVKRRGNIRLLFLPTMKKVCKREHREVR